jgi:hypothetical protein
VIDIPEKGVYTPYFLNCESSTRMSFNLQYVFMNGESHLDTRWRPALVYSPVFIGLGGAVILYWIVNWVVYFTLKIKVHYLLTLVFILSVVAQSVWFGQLHRLQKTGISSTQREMPFMIVNAVYRAALLITILLLGSGWYIVRKDLPCEYVVPGGLATIVYVSLGVVSGYLLSGWTRIVVAMIGVGILAAYVRCVSLAMRSSSAYIVAHMLVIQQSGIAPKTTPVYEKYLMMRRALAVIVVFCILFVVSTLLDLLLNNFVWPPMFIESLVSLGITSALAWMMSLRKERRKNYYLLDESEGGDAPEIALQELENMNPESSELSQGGRPYEDGMTLPRAPRIRNSRSQTETAPSAAAPEPEVEELT